MRLKLTFLIARNDVQNLVTGGIFGKMNPGSLATLLVRKESIMNDNEVEGENQEIDFNALDAYVSEMQNENVAPPPENAASPNQEYFYLYFLISLMLVLVDSSTI